jgi:hypothetical protein
MMATISTSWLMNPALFGDISHAASQKTAAKVTKAVSAHHR